MKLQAKNLTKKYQGKAVVDQLNITLKPGEILGLLGPNGAGKTTFFYMIAGLIRSDSGKILIDEEDVTDKTVSVRASMGLAYLPQEPSVFGRLTVEENILAALEQRRDINKEQKKRELEKLVEEFQLKKFLKTKSIKLSGGERRRVEIARSLSSNPSFILLDEPFAGIDPKAVSELKETLKKLKNLKLGILISDHNVRETMQICDNVLIMNEGKVIAEGTPEKVSANDLVKEIYLGQDF
ncbi:MAG TPA: LPS export ABC transporter ATP-binding protein [Gammaproteobacteria bacterium]|jgi:lipopolysaccharide export system ATP-binding protein|nr:LPS export ABC transporter ATP-binding protein [Gammaproteobacteria bacterium]HIB74329.1 LPS export ABC transporter ATP-binding protein [Gammaproteobacteria bacterium]HIO05053.1 LPS export ABC transporter ATP-binding protein [Gammaproteobacteria bacterium]|tara:strand:- start:2494 stop:3210 length:717 start_codon:yes stop_codon:yes gene_type:complete